MEYTFGFYNPVTFKPMDPINNPDDMLVLAQYGFDCVGFQSINVGNARINGIDFTFTGAGKLFGLPTTLLAGYTYTNPIDKNSFDVPDSLKTTDSEILKYRNYHSAKADIEVKYKKVSTGLSFVYNSRMINIDKAFEDLMGDGPGVGLELLPGLYDYRQKHNKGYIVFDYRISYTYNEHSKFSFVVKNLFNKEYMGRPGDLRPPRNISLQYVLSF
jgi:iron complex outermembrane receptor protein